MSTTVLDHALKERETQTLTSGPARRVVFISHAKPEDNPAAAWFATQLTLLGYEVWCDLKNTHGGESDFWLKVQKIIENEAAKFVYILSNTSCDFQRKKGIYKEVQAADNLRIDNFIIPIRIERLTSSLPILFNTSLYINGENWAEGLHDLVERLREDNVPKRSDIDFEKVSSWWPAISIEKVLYQAEDDEIVSNVLRIQELPRLIHFIRVLSDRNPITGFEQLRKVLPKRPAYYPHGGFAISFANPIDFAELVHGFDFENAYILDTQAFLSSGHEETGIIPDIARNILTYLVSEAWNGFMGSKNLSPKQVGRGKRTIWFARDGLIPNNRASLAEPGKRKVSIHLVGSVKHYRKSYKWHFGLLPSVNLDLNEGIVLTPKAVISPRYNAQDGELPNPIDNKKVLKKLNWWNKEWRQKFLAILSWLSEGQPEIVIPTGYQQLVLSSVPQSHLSDTSFKEMSDDEVINQAMESIVEHALSP